MARTIVEISGHIIDSLILPKVLDQIINMGGEFEILDIHVGQRRADRSSARIQIDAPDLSLLDKVLEKIKEHGATPLESDNESVELQPVASAGVFPDQFYSTTNLPTAVRVNGKWIDVELIEMDCGIKVDLQTMRAQCVPIHRVRPGDSIVVGHRGVKIFPLERQVPRQAFEFMTSAISTEQPKDLLIGEIAQTMKQAREAQGRILVVAGPGLVHTGAARHLVELIERGYVQLLFAGNGLAVHDIESALYGTSWGVSLENNIRPGKAPQHHLRATNEIRKAGSIKSAVDQAIIRSGIFYTCVKHNVDFVLAGSIRDDGPLPDVITDTLRAQDVMRDKARGISLALMMATTLHAIATGNLLPATVKTVCVDINPAVVTKLSDRGTFQATGLVTDVEPFLRSLCRHLAER